jgi:hypothetical protein
MLLLKSIEDETLNIAHNDFVNNNGFRISMMSKLVLNVKNVSYLCIDSTYKLNVYGFPIIVLGTVNKCGKFILLSISICDTETSEDFKWVFEQLKLFNPDLFQKPIQYVMSDADSGIKKAVSKTFPESKQLMCWFHVCLNLRPMIKQLNSSFASNINSDIRFIQCAYTESVFDKMVKLFIKKYEQFDECANFLNRFKASWVLKNKNWFEGAAILYPSTNNAVEGFNNNFKKNFHKWKQSDMFEMLKNMKKIILAQEISKYNQKILIFSQT